VRLYRLSPPDPRQLAEQQEVERRKQRLWHQQQVEEAVQTGQWFAARFHLRRLHDLDPGDAHLYALRGMFWAEQAQWDQAVADFAHASELEPRQVLYLYHWGFALLAQQAELEQRSAPARCLAAVALPTPARPLLAAQCVHLGAQQALAFRGYCNTLLQRFKETQDPETAGLVTELVKMRPDSVDDWEPVLRLAALAVKRRPSGEYRETWEAALYRAGHYTEARKELQEDVPSEGEGGTLGQQLFLAMTEQRLGHAAKAKQWLDRAVRLMEATEKPGWEDRIRWRLLRAEAEGLIHAGQPRPRPAP
jgi:tetratricopeptide (TPR) repeat protein